MQKPEKGHKVKVPRVREWWRLSPNGKLIASHLHPHGNLGPELPELTFQGKADFQIFMWNLLACIPCQLCATLYDPMACSPQGCSVAHKAALSMGFPKQEFWSGLPFPPPRDHPNSRIKPSSLTMQRILYHLATGEPLNKKAWLLWLSGRRPVLHLIKDLQMSEAATLKCYKHWEGQNLHLSQHSSRKISVFKLLCCLCSQFFSMIPKIVPCPLPSS